MLTLLLFFACMSTERKTTDHDLYMSAIEESSANKALVSCERIAVDSVKGECILFAAKAAVESGLDAIKFCDASPNEDWRGACLFEVADISGATGPQADTICKQTGAFAKRCFYHALQREENHLMSRYGMGEEKQLIQDIQQRLSAINIKELEEEPLSEELCARIIAKRFLMSWKRLPTLPFRKAVCGNAPDKVCEATYRFIIKLRLKEGKTPQCDPSPNSQEAILLGFPGWETPMDAAVASAWRNICGQMNGLNQKRPDHQASQRK